MYVHTYAGMLCKYILVMLQAACYAILILIVMEISIQQFAPWWSSSFTHIRITWHNDITGHKTCFIGCDRDEIILST